MAKNAPTASISGEQDWEWNQWQAAERARRREGVSEPPTTDSRPSEASPSYREMVAALQRENRELEAQIGRKEHHLHHVITQYERILEERNRELRERTGSDAGGDCLAEQVSNLFRRLIGR